MPERSVQQKADETYERIYREEVGYLNRKERRTALGKLAVANAHIKALQAKCDFLEEEFREYQP